MTYRMLHVFTVLLPPLLIGGFEYIRHDFLLPYISMEQGNFLITVLSFLLSLLYASWMFRTIRRINDRLVQEQAKRAVYEERERLARELHDGIAQTLFFLNVKLRQGNYDEARTAVSAIDNQVRQAIFNLRSSPEEGVSLSLRLNKWLSEWSTLTGVEVNRRISLPDKYFSPAEEVQLFAIVQEAFANIRKHAQARSASIALESFPAGGWRLVIADDGIGLSAADTDNHKYGLKMMRERAAQLGADFHLEGRTPGGTTICLTAVTGGKHT